MRLTLQLRFYTRPGQSLWVTGRHELFGGGDFSKALPLQYLDDRLWGTTLPLPDGDVPGEDLTYTFVLREPDGSLVEDWEGGRSLNPGRFKVEELRVIEAWNSPAFSENTFYTEPFTEVLLKSNQTEIRTAPQPGSTHLFKVKAPLLQKHQTLCLLGDTPVLGNWDTDSPVLLNRIPGEDCLTVELDLSAVSFPLAYKYGVFDVQQKRFVRYEDGENRTLSDTIAPGKFTVVSDGFAVLPANTWKGAGVAVPVFSLRTNRSFGVGEFSDLKLLADWCQQTGLKLIQVLPVNDTTATHTWIDSYPYAAVSAFALHPIYLNLREVADRRNQGLVAKLEPERTRLNSLEAVDYAAVINTKMRCLKELYKLQRDQTFRAGEYRKFFESNKSWLVPYAVYSYLRDEYGGPDSTKWPGNRECTANDLASLASEGAPSYEGVALHYFLQFHLHRQLLEAVQYAHERGVILNGDIPIGVHRHGADVWQSPDLYCLDMQAGAPPDPFSAKGQNWGFPTYNWPRMKATGFAWWKQRFAQMERYFDAFRIDHILGFFRIWSVPLHAVEGILGHFVPALPVRLQELTARGIAFERERYLQPFINDQVLADVFAGDAEFVKATFLCPAGSGNYALKPEFATQKQVEAHFASGSTGERVNRLKQGLFDLISNVLLFEAEESNGGAFHFRFGLENTSSFHNLAPQTQCRLAEFYVDYFFRRQESFWRQQAMEKLPALKRATNMLICGEDLGMVPACVPEVMRQLGLLGLEIQRMPKALGREFSRPGEAEYLSVVTPSTHDMSTIRGWWTDDRNITQRFYNVELGQAGEAPADCEPWVVEKIVRQHLASPAMWSIFQLQDLLGLDGELRRLDAASERINVPANPGNYWRYRMHLPMENLIYAIKLNRLLRQLLAEHGR